MIFSVCVVKIIAMNACMLCKRASIGWQKRSSLCKRTESSHAVSLLFVSFTVKHEKRETHQKGCGTRWRRRLEFLWLREEEPPNNIYLNTSHKLTAQLSYKGVSSCLLIYIGFYFFIFPFLSFFSHNHLVLPGKENFPNSSIIVFVGSNDTSLPYRSPDAACFPKPLLLTSAVLRRGSQGRWGWWVWGPAGRESGRRGSSPRLLLLSHGPHPLRSQRDGCSLEKSFMRSVRRVNIYGRCAADEKEATGGNRWGDGEVKQEWWAGGSPDYTWTNQLYVASVMQRHGSAHVEYLL